MMWPGMECGVLSTWSSPVNLFSAHLPLPWVPQEYVSLAEVLQLCSRLDPYASAISPSAPTQPLPDSEVPVTACAHLCLGAFLWVP